MRGFIDDVTALSWVGFPSMSQSAFMRGFIDDVGSFPTEEAGEQVSIRVHARLHR